MNRYQFIGNIGADAEIRRMENNPERCAISFSVAVSEKWKNAAGEQQERTTWVRCTIWRKQDQLKIAEYLRKGQKVYVEGKPQARAYTNKDGEATASLEVTVDNLELLGGAQQNGQQAAAPQQSTYQQQAEQIQQQPFGTHQRPAADDDLPF